MVEVDVRQEEVPDVSQLQAALREAGAECRECRGRSAVEECKTVVRLDDIAADAVRDALVVKVDRAEVGHTLNLSDPGRAMLIATTNDVAGHEVKEVFGEVFGLTVRSRHLGSQIGASLKSLFGGELAGMTKMLAEGREEAIRRVVAEAEARGANAILAFRFDTSELGRTWTEICAYGTAVRIERLR